jgi:malonyl-CoA O-methyltransferase
MSEGVDEIDSRAVRRAFGRAAAGYDATAGLEREVADELLDRLAGVRVEPARVADLGCGTGYAAHRLQRMYRRAEVLAIDFAPAMAARAAGSGWRPGRRPLGVCADACRLPLPDQSVDVVFSSLALQWIGDLAALFTEIRRVLTPEGVLMFSTLGPDSLFELRAAWAAADDGVHVSTFLDMHDIGDAALRAGLTDPVMDVDRVQREYPDVRSLMRSLKAAGAQNAARGRRRALTGRTRLARAEAAYPERDPDGRIRATWEIAYGHAWGAATPRAGSGSAQEFHVPIESIGRRRANGDGRGD